MGLKSAGSYFQHVMSSLVLSGLMYVMLELYIDDCIIFAKDEDELCERVDKFLSRVVEKNITVNPDKTRIGLQQIEYVGHVLDAYGMHFTQDKLDGVKNFPLPRTPKELRSFIGLVNYFCNHIKNHSEVMRPLRTILPADNRKKLIWSAEAVNAFEEAKLAVSNCPKLFFLSTEGKVVLCTDASDYGLGAYLYQTVNGVEQPIMFISKSFNSVQLRWSTIEKEGFAIYYALQKMEHLLRDIHFSVLTDHKNLVYITTSGSAKVIRWKLAIQEFDYEIEHIDGVKNVVADAFSRMCPVSDKSEYLHAFEEYDHTKQSLLMSKLQENDCTCTYCPTVVNSSEYCFGLTEVKNTRKRKATERQVTLQHGIYNATALPANVYKSISSVHNTIAGHHGLERTLWKLTRKDERWKHMREDIRQFIDECPYCQKTSQIKTPIITKRFTTHSYSPMQCINVDTIGPLPVDHKGNEHILVIIDCFTRFVTLHAMADTSAECAVDALLQHIGTFGCPRYIKTDNGSQFINKTMTELVDIIGTEHARTIAYSKEENGIVERANKEVMRHLRAFTFELNEHREWSKYLPLVQRIINATVHSSIGTSPSNLLFGQAINLDQGITLPFDVLQGDSNLSDWSADMLNIQQSLLNIAAATLYGHHIEHTSEQPPVITEFEIDSYVLVDYPNNSLNLRGAPTKLHTLKKGPFRVISHTGDSYRLLNLALNTEEPAVHVSRLSPFRYDQNRTIPTNIANRDYQLFNVDSIIHHQGDTKRKSSLNFLVHWEGYSHNEDSWEPWAELRNNPKLHAYLRTKNLHMLIPKEHRNQ
jgi:transposase InsO family protein